MSDDPTTTAAISDPERLSLLRRARLLDAPPEPAFDRLTRIASRLLEAPISLVTLIEEDRQYFLSCVGLPDTLTERRQTPLSYSICKHVVATGDPLIVTDIAEHPLFRDDTMVRSFGIAGYAGIPLRTATGHVLGRFCEALISSGPATSSRTFAGATSRARSPVRETSAGRERRASPRSTSPGQDQ